MAYSRWLFSCWYIYWHGEDKLAILLAKDSNINIFDREKILKALETDDWSILNIGDEIPEKQVLRSSCINWLKDIGMNFDNVRESKHIFETKKEFNDLCHNIFNNKEFLKNEIVRLCDIYHKYHFNTDNGSLHILLSDYNYEDHWIKNIKEMCRKNKDMFGLDIIKLIQHIEENERFEMIRRVK